MLTDVSTQVAQGEVLLAHPIALLAIPALAPAVVLILVVLWVARRDRLAEDAERPEGADDGSSEPEKPKRRSRLEIG